MAKPRLHQVAPDKFSGEFVSKIKWLILATLVVCYQVFAGVAIAGDSTGQMSAIVLEDATLKDENGAELSTLKRFDLLTALCLRGHLLEVLWSPAKGEAGRRAFLPAGKATVVPGPPESHRRRLARIEKAGFTDKLATRLLEGRLVEGDTFPLVEMAWGKPQRSFMVNFFADEQHYIYFRQGQKVILRFKGGRLSPPFPTK